MRLLLCLAIATGLAIPQTPWDGPAIRSAVEATAATVAREYFDPRTGAAVAESLRDRLAKGRYSSIATPAALAAALTRDLNELTHDKHLAASVIRPPSPESPRPAESREERARRTNAGVQRVEILRGNVGYLNITGFDRPEFAAGPIGAAMAFLRQADALIVDLRENGGGSPDTAALFAGYFFDQPGITLFDIVARDGSSRSYKTPAVNAPGANGRRPVNLLTSARTFSAGEGIAFLLREHGRAEVIGETTAGAANPGRPYPVNGWLEVTVPNGRVRGAVSGGNWEGKGVVPDIGTSAGDALQTAHARALARLQR